MPQTRRIEFDFNNMFSFSVGRVHGVTGSDIEKLSVLVQGARRHIKEILQNDLNRIGLGLEWARLPLQDRSSTDEIQKLGDEIAGRFKNVISLGIGGSYLGLKAAQDALRPSYYNEFPSARKGRPKIYFEGNNLDPDTLSVLLGNLNPKETCVIVISKSGETTETMAAFDVIEPWLKKGSSVRYGRRIFVITDPKSGSLRERALKEGAKDALSFRSLPVLRGVGGRFSELNVGLLHLAVIGVDIQDLLSGAHAMLNRCLSLKLSENPAYLYAALQTVLYRKKNKTISIIMPFSETLKSTADWYCQLLAESLGKKYGRRIKIGRDGSEVWKADKGNTVNAGRTPIACRGTNDLHSIHQNNAEGENNKTVTFIRVENFKHDIRIPRAGDFLSGKLYSKLIAVAQEATEWALTRESRPNSTIIMPEVNPYHWGELILFFEMATAFEGELLNVNAFDQPGVEGYKNYMYHKLHKPGISQRVVTDIIKNPLIKLKKYIL